RVDRPVADDALLVRRRGAEDHRPIGPHERRAVLRRLGEQLELVHGEGALAVRRAEAVGARVAAAEDHDALAGRADLPGHRIAGVRLVLLRQELHREVDAAELASRHGEVARPRRAAGEHDGIELAPEVVGGHVDADVHVRAEGDALGRHLLHAAVDEPLLHLEVRDAVAQQPPDPVRALEEDDVVAGARELLRARHAGRPRADDGHALSRLRGGERRRDHARLPGAVDDRLLDRLDRDRVVVDVEDARLLARRRADAARELREVVRRVEADGRLPPPAPVHEVVPVGDDVPERAALVTEGDAAVHAPRALLAELLLREPELELAPVLEPLGDGLLVRRLPLVLEEAGDLTHASCPCVVPATQTDASRAASVSRCCFASTCRYSTGITLTTCLTVSFQPESSRHATAECVKSKWRWMSAFTVSTSAASSGSSPTIPLLSRRSNVPSSSSTNATPPLMPAAKLRPVRPRTRTRPFVMYSQPWSPTPSTTAVAPEFRTQKRSPASPRRKTSPPVAP